MLVQSDMPATQQHCQGFSDALHFLLSRRAFASLSTRKMLQICASVPFSQAAMSLQHALVKASSSDGTQHVCVNCTSTSTEVPDNIRPTSRVSSWCTHNICVSCCVFVCVARRLPENGPWTTTSSALDFCTRTSTTRTCGDGLVSLYIYISVTYQSRWSPVYLSQHVQGSSKSIVVCPDYYGQIFSHADMQLLWVHEDSCEGTTFSRGGHPFLSYATLFHVDMLILQNLNPVFRTHDMNSHVSITLMHYCF